MLEYLNCRMLKRVIVEAFQLVFIHSATNLHHDLNEEKWGLSCLNPTVIRYATVDRMDGQASV